MNVKHFLIIISSLFLYGVSGEASPYNYHERVGIRTAEEIRLVETVSRSLARIIGGTEVSEQSHIAFQAGIIIILTTGWTSVCGGSLVSNTKVLTAAHCQYDGRNTARQFTIVLGSTTLFTGGTRLVTTSVVMHPSWNTVDFTHDVAVVTISRVEYTNTIQPVVLPTIDDMNQDFAGFAGIVSGYGKISDAQGTFPITTSLHQTTVNIITNTVCQQSFDFNIHTGHLCTSGTASNVIVGTCDGDSGGPLTVVYNNIRTQVGIVSFGPDSCESGLPSIYTRLTTFINWIQANL